MSVENVENKENKTTFKEKFMQFLEIMHGYWGDYFSGGQKKWKPFDEQKTR